MRIAILLALLASQAIADPIDRTLLHEGELVYAHIGYRDNPCRSSGERGGCYALVKTDHHIWYSASAPAFVLLHELAHVKGMRHTEWSYGPRGAWAIVTQAGPGYPLGATIFDNGYREFVF